MSFRPTPTKKGIFHCCPPSLDVGGTVRLLIWAMGMGFFSEFEFSGAHRT
jgi:hypothetical protein